MSLYWLHIHEGTEITGYGPFASEADLLDFRLLFADDEDENGYRRSLDERPVLPGSLEHDEHESDTWVGVEADNLSLRDGWDIYPMRKVARWEVDS